MKFQFGYECRVNLIENAENVAEAEWKRQERPAAYERSGPSRTRHANAKRDIIRQREYEHLELQYEEDAKYNYRPGACKKDYRMVLISKNISKEKGERRLLDEVRYFFHISNDGPNFASEEVVFGANDRCDQENLIAQLSGGVRSLWVPVDNLLSNWAYMVMTSVACNLQSSTAMLIPINPAHHEEQVAEKKRLLKMEFPTFLDVFVHVPCRILRHARRTVHRLLDWADHTPAFLRLCAMLNL